MSSNDYLQALSARLAAIFPAASAMRKELEDNIYQQLQKSFSRLNLVSREDFDAQLAALRRAEETIAALEAKIEILEQRNAAKPGSGDEGPVTADGRTSES